MIIEALGSQEDRYEQVEALLRAEVPYGNEIHPATTNRRALNGGRYLPHVHGVSYDG
jgi:hypothetical protein